MATAWVLLVPFLDGTASDPVPDANDVKAGWGALFLFVMLIVAVVILARSLVKQLRKAQAARDAGVYGDPPATPAEGATDGTSDGTSNGGAATPPRPGAAPR
jgi:hypothetical protein